MKSFVALLVPTLLFLALPAGTAQGAGYLFDGHHYVKLPGVVGANDGVYLDVNNSGTTVGYYHDGVHTRGFLQNSGVITLFDGPPGDVIAGSINNKGDIAGSYVDAGGYNGFVYRDGVFETISHPLAQFGTFVSGINDFGDIVGTYSLYPNGVLSEMRSFILHDGTFLDFVDPLASGQYRLTNAQSINNNRQVVGYYTKGSLLNNEAFLYDSGSFSDLAAGIAVDISNDGSILLATSSGYQLLSGGAIRGVPTPSGQYGGLTGMNDLGMYVGNFGPIPEPASWLTAILGFLGVGFALRGRRAGPPYDAWDGRKPQHRAAGSPD